MTLVKKLWLYLILVLFLTTSCQGATSTPSPTEVPPTPSPTPLLYQTNDGITLGTNANCPDRSAFGEVIENVPTSNALVSYPILFRWYYAAAEGAAPDWANVCVPTSFTLYLAPGPDYDTPLSFEITPTSAENLVNLLMYSYDLNNSLQPHTTYRWMVVGHADGIDIGDDRLPLFQDEDAWKLVNNQSQMSGQFQTGPVCDPNTIGPANLLTPPDEAALETDSPTFQWDMPNCSATAYWLKFDTDPQMGSVDIGWVTGQESFLVSQGLLQPCLIYYWQVEAGLYSTSYHIQSGDWATASGIQSFILRSPDCPNAVAVPSPMPTLPPTATLVPPTHTPVPTSTPVVCAAQPDKESCESHSDQCYWSQDLNGGFSCKPKP